MSSPNNVIGSFNDAKNPVGQCPVKSSVMSIVPVRYAIDDQIPDPNFPGNPGMHIGKHPLPKAEHWQGPLQLKENTYTLRQLRNGWLYVYDETAETFHEYQVKGPDLIKIDWGSNEADSDTEKRGSPGQAQPFLNYPSQNKLYMAYSAHRWSWRVCEHMRSDSSSRHQWMRGVNLKQFCHTLKSPDAGYIDDLADRVADIYDGAAPDETTFINTCTPLKKPENSAEPEALSPLVAEKPATAKGAVMKGMPDPTTAMFVALDDPLGDITDLVLQLSTVWTQKEARLGDEETIHKLRMAEIVREIGRVRVPEEKLNQLTREDPARILECEEMLNQYLLIHALAEEDKRRLESPTYDPNEDLPPSGMAETAEKIAQKLKDYYGLTVTTSMQTQWSQTYIYQKEVDWDSLTAFLTTQYQALAGLDKKITAHYEDVLLGISQLSDEALSIGIDTQEAADISYLLDLVSQSVVILKMAIPGEKQHHHLEKTLSLNSPKNLFALASSGFSKASWMAIDAQIQALHKQVLSVKNPGDDLALVTAIANWDTLIGDARIQDKAWFQALVAPVQKNFAALSTAAKTTAANSWQAVMDLMLPAYRNPDSLIDSLRGVLLEAIVDEKAILEVNPNYLKEAAAIQSQLKPLLSSMAALTHPETGVVIQVSQFNQLQAEVDRIIQTRYPQLLRVKGVALSEKAQQTVTGYIQGLRNTTGKAGSAIKSGIGGWGRLLVGVGIWNTYMVLMSLPQKLSAADTDQEKLKALLEPLYSALYTTQFAYALSLERVWGQVSVDKDLMATSIKKALSRKGSIDVTEQVLLKRFSNLMLTTSALGMLASGLEAWDNYHKLQNSDNTSLEAVGYWMKGVATAGNTFIFGAQFILQITSRFIGKVAMSATLAPWMLTGLFWMGIVYLVGVILINLFHRDDVAKFLFHSTWGNKSSGWSFREELTRFEQLMYRPVVRLVRIAAPKQQYAAIYAPAHQWQIEIDLPSLVKQGESLGLQITRTPISNGAINMAGTPVLVNEQNGRWQRIEQDKRHLLRYSIAVGGTDQAIVTLLLRMPLYLWPATQKEAPDAACHLLYGTYGSTEGIMNLTVLDAETNTKSTRTVAVTV